jgi:hypothetical protein
MQVVLGIIIFYYCSRIFWSNNAEIVIFLCCYSVSFVCVNALSRLLQNILEQLLSFLFSGIESLSLYIM